MNPSTPTHTPHGAPDETERSRERIDLGLALDPNAHSPTLARLIAASVHTGEGTALERFAATGRLSRQKALAELNRLSTSSAREGWIDALGHHILFASGDHR